MDVPEGYTNAADAVLRAVRQWKRQHPASRPSISMINRVAVVGTISETIESPFADLNRSGIQLARYVDGRVKDATWLMFYASWEIVYGKPS